MLSKSKFKEILGKNIARERKRQDLKQDALSVKCGFYRTYINLVEREKRTPSSYTLYKIANTLGIEVDKLYPSTV